MSEPASRPAPAAEAATPDSPQERRFSNRSIRSFVLRQGRMSSAQQRHLEQMMPRVGIAYREALIDLDEVFGRSAPRVLEVGFGMGETTARIAAEQPQTDFIAIEVHGPGVGNLCKLIDERGLSNIRIMQHDAVEVMRDMIAPEALAGVHVFFPDPWHKKRHHKRRIIQPGFVSLVASRLQRDGYLHCATDWPEYADWMLEVLSGEPQLENSAAGFAPRPGCRPLTKFEQRGLERGHEVRDLIFRRR